MLKRIVLAALLTAAASSALAQTAQLNAGQVWANPTAAPRPGMASSVTSVLDRALGSTRGSILRRGVTDWAIVGPSASTGLAWVSQGTGADPVYGVVGLVGGGCNAALTASNGGILYSTAAACAVMPGTATARLPLLSGASTIPTWGSFTLPLSVTSGGVPYFSSTSVMASSALLTANALVFGGGAGAAPATGLGLGTTTQVLHGNAGGLPTWGAVGLTTDVTGTLPIANGGTGQTTAVAARQGSGLNIWGDSGTGHGDTNATIGNTERMAYTTAAFTGPRTWTLPAANVTGAPYTVQITDMASAVSGANTLTIQRAGSDTVNGGGSSVTISATGGSYQCSSDGTSKWSCQSTGAASAGGVTGVTITAGTGISVSGTCNILTSGTCTIKNEGVVVVSRQILTASAGTYTPTTGTLYAIVECVGSGGGGGGVSVTGAALYALTGNGGGSGGYSRGVYTSPSATAYTIGAAGTGGSGASSGGGGGAASMAGVCVANGGGGGAGTSTASFVAPPSGGVAGTGNIETAQGNPGGGGYYQAFAATTNIFFPNAGLGASSRLGPGPAGIVIASGAGSTGSSGVGYGSGGSGGVSNQQAGSNQSGGNGVQGVFYITEFIRP